MKLYGENPCSRMDEKNSCQSQSDWHMFLWPTMRYHWEGNSTFQKNRFFDNNWFPRERVLMVLLFSLVTSLPRHLCSPRVQRCSRMKLCSQASSIAIDELSSFKVAIVGGGYTGLACGHHLQQLFLNSTVPPKHLNLSFFAREPEPTGTIHGTWCASAVSAGLLVSVYLSLPAVIPNECSISIHWYTDW